MTIERLPAIMVPVSTATSANVSFVTQQQQLVNEAALLQRQISLETAQLASESAQLRGRVTLLQSAAIIQPKAATATSYSGRAASSPIPKTHATTGASSNKSDNDDNGGDNSD